jgi:hypothetical protein
MIGAATSLVGLLLFGVLTSVITKALMGPVFGTETVKPVVEPEVFFYDEGTGAVGTSTSMATANVDNLVSLGIIDAAEASALRERVVGPAVQVADGDHGTKPHGH